MAQSTSYGIGQYRYDPTFKGQYITHLYTTTSADINYVEYTPDLVTTYSDVAIALPDGIDYGNTYYMEITLPQDQYYDTTLNLKLCAEAEDANTNFQLNFNKFQQIKRIIVPSLITSSGDSLYKEVILFEYIQDNQTVVDADIPQIVTNTSASLTASQLYEHDGNYKYAIAEASGWSDSAHLVPVTNYSKYNLSQGWKVTESSQQQNNPTITYKFVFSPKYNLTNAYKYLWLEIVHDNEDVRFSDRNIRYDGRTIPINNISMTLYKITNLLPEKIFGIAAIKSGINSLTGVTITGNSDFIAAINGEEIKIGRTGQYEVKDFDITSLGLVVRDSGETSQDTNFLIDYTYTIKN